MALIRFALFLIAFVIKATYIFLVSFIAISLIVHLSPFIIPLILFEKTKGIFDATVKNMLSFIIQPVLLYAYVGIFLTILDGVVTGDAIYKGGAPKKELYCKKTLGFGSERNSCASSLSAIDVPL